MPQHKAPPTHSGPFLELSEGGEIGAAERWGIILQSEIASLSSACTHQEQDSRQGILAPDNFHQIPSNITRLKRFPDEIAVSETKAAKGHADRFAAKAFSQGTARRAPLTCRRRYAASRRCWRTADAHPAYRQRPKIAASRASRPPRAWSQGDRFGQSPIKPPSSR